MFVGKVVVGRVVVEQKIAKGLVGMGRIIVEKDSVGRLVMRKVFEG